MSVPAGRRGGAAFERACGHLIAQVDKHDPTGPVQALVKAAAPGRLPPACDLSFCRGYQTEDIQDDNVQRYSLGGNVAWEYRITEAHPDLGDTAKVTLYDATAKSPLLNGEKVFSVSNFSHANNTVVRIDYTIPSTPLAQAELKDRCKSKGACVAVFDWNIDNPLKHADYVSCVDFIID
ncbi:hypothetical protein PYCC9005_000980 [Savitreella phatthalungensis]